MGFVKSIIDFLAGFFIEKSPPRCAVCGSLVKNEELWCGNCIYLAYGKIEYSRYRHKFAGAVAGAQYAVDMKSAIWRIKRTPDKRTLQYLAMLMQHYIAEDMSGVQFDVIIPVPISKEKLKERGFNQSEKLADALSEIIGVPVEPEALIRYDNTEIQHTLNKQSRFANAAKSYAATDSDCVKGKTVLLVDDLYTTGATVSACTDRLLEMGAKSVYVATAVVVLKKPQIKTAPPPEPPPITEKREYPMTTTRRVAFTGHRPHTIGLPEDEASPAMLALKEALAYRIDYLIEHKRVTSFLSGLAIGTDTIAAEMILKRMVTNPDLELEVVIPFKGQADRWKPKDKARYDAILSSGKVVQRYTPDERYIDGQSYQRRNAYLAEQCRYLIAVWNGERSGTGMTVNMAQKLGKRCIIIDPKEYSDLV